MFFAMPGDFSLQSNIHYRKYLQSKFDLVVVTEGMPLQPNLIVIDSCDENIAEIIKRFIISQNQILPAMRFIQDQKFTGLKTFIIDFGEETKDKERTLLIIENLGIWQATDEQECNFD